MNKTMTVVIWLHCMVSKISNEILWTYQCWLGETFFGQLFYVNFALISDWFLSYYFTKGVLEFLAYLFMCVFTSAITDQKRSQFAYAIVAPLAIGMFLLGQMCFKLKIYHSKKWCKTVVRSEDFLSNNRSVLLYITIMMLIMVI